MRDVVRYQLFLPRKLAEQLETLAAKPGASKSAILTDAMTAWLNRRGASDLEDRFSLRIDRISMSQGRLDREVHVISETLGLFILYQLSVLPPLAEDDHAGRALGAKRFKAFVAQVSRLIGSGHRSFDVDAATPPEEEA
ncbi:MAG: CopG family transcriptional regulator [Zymomonas sp.]|nr:MAG: CopG family transcriptional regulator [Zymomonas sp.]